ncbi:hypothetical protein IVB03_07830 [Bradyrhizobium sp. 168]|uniref:hypothetical protein n=1 Tax=Bradyrhizobium sp. 168 TaxID=2782639 RepID=UPI001FF75C8A|nr:hypothetical protein [Bradyrhizobium sp. 168]MCK1579491.1 hypothetical protein [Bradyrhizobium sp. 168]
MKALSAIVLATGLSFVSYVPLCMAEDASFTRRPNEMGRKISTVTSYQVRSAGGPQISCAGTCFAAGQTVEWKCDAHQNAYVHCRLDCNSLPAQGHCADQGQ